MPAPTPEAIEKAKKRVAQAQARLQDLNARAAAIACYRERGAELAATIAAILREWGVTAEPAAAAWLAGTVLGAGTALQHKLAHVLGGLGLPHAETHAVILPHVTRFNLSAAPAARALLAAHHPSLYLEMHGADDADKSRRVASIVATLRSLGYEEIHLLESGRRVEGDTAFARRGHLVVQGRR